MSKQHTKFINVRYTDEGCNEFKFLCCGYVQESRSEPMNYCPNCGSLVIGETIKRAGSYRNFIKKRIYRNGKRYRIYAKWGLHNKKPIGKYVIFNRDEPHGEFIGSGKELLKIVKFLNANKAGNYPSWLDWAESVESFEDIKDSLIEDTLSIDDKADWSVKFVARKFFIPG